MQEMAEKQEVRSTEDERIEKTLRGYDLNPLERNEIGVFEKPRNVVEQTYKHFPTEQEKEAVLDCVFKEL